MRLDPRARGDDGVDSSGRPAPEGSRSCGARTGGTGGRASAERELEGVVAKRRSGRYLPDQVGWVKAKNRDYWRYKLEREAVVFKRRATAPA
jgi:hypothetical protein